MNKNKAKLPWDCDFILLSENWRIGYSSVKLDRAGQVGKREYKTHLKIVILRWVSIYMVRKQTGVYAGV